MSSIDLTKLSRALSHALRHEPWLYELGLDGEGWAPLPDVVAALREERADWSDLTDADILRLIGTAVKQRFDVADGRIRAFYGHSLPEKLRKTPAAPPDVLYHGTSPEALTAIREAGLRPMRRQYVHLSSDEATAHSVGQRKTSRATILKIAGAEAHAAGVKFYHGNERVWLADDVPPEFISF